MITKIGAKLTDVFQKNMPNAFVFALILTLVTGLIAILWIGVTPMEVVKSWYGGFWNLLEFGMQMVLLVVTGYSIALSPLIKNAIDKLTKFINTPTQVYFFSVLIGVVLSMVSWGWIVIAAVLARELALRVKGVNYPFLIACVYFSNNSWVAGLSSSIPLLLNTENNYMIEAGILTETIPTAYTLGSYLNIGMIVLFIIVSPLVMVFLVPKKKKVKELKDMMGIKDNSVQQTIKEEAAQLKLPFRAISDSLNNSTILQWFIAILGIAYIFDHFRTKGLDLNLNIMIFIFLVLGLILHKTPIRYTISMQRSSTNVSGILFQFPFYAGIMGIMTYTGLGEKLAQVMASYATIETFPFFAYILGGVVNFAIPSGGGEFAVIGPSVIEAVGNIASGLSPQEMIELNSRAALSIAYGESLTNLLQPFYLLLVLPVMGAGINIQARDVMGYLVLPFVLFFVIQSIMIIWMPM